MNVYHPISKNLLNNPEAIDNEEVYYLKFKILFTKEFILIVV